MTRHIGPTIRHNGSPAARPRRRFAFLALCLALALAGCSKTELYSNLREREANEMLALLLRAGIDAEKIPGKGGVTISVESRRVPEAIQLLNAAGLPQNQYASIGELFKREGMISSPSEERVRYMYGITQELQRTLTTIDGVLSARVHIVLPGNDPTTQTTKPSSAAVLIRFAADAAVEALVPKIKELVINSIEGLSYDRVSVVLVKATGEEMMTRLVDQSRQAMPPDTALSWPLVYGLGAGLVVTLLGNLGLGFLIWRRSTASAASTPTAT